MVADRSAPQLHYLDGRLRDCTAETRLSNLFGRAVLDRRVADTLGVVDDDASWYGRAFRGMGTTRYCWRQRRLETSIGSLRSPVGARHALLCALLDLGLWCALHFADIKKGMLGGRRY